VADIFKAGDVEGYDFAFDATGQIIDWAPVVKRAESGDVTLEVDLAMLFTTDGKVGHTATTRVNIPEGADEQTIKRHVYAATRNYIKRIARRIREAEQEDDMDVDVGDLDTSVDDGVALMAAVRV
jgi:hypothetical protein